jgi:hypothetical protein
MLRLKPTAARTLLTQHRLIEEDKTDLDSLTNALIKIAGQLGKVRATKSSSDAIKAVVTLLEDATVDAMAEKIAKTVAEKLSAHTMRAETAADQLDQVSAHSLARAKDLEEAMNGIKNAMEESNRSLADAATDLNAAVLSSQGGRGREMSLEPGESGGVGGDPAEKRGRSYADAIRDTPAEHIDAIARTEIMRRQVVMRRDPAAGADCFEGLSEKELILKAKIAVDLIQSEDVDTIDHVDFVHAKKTAGGGVVLVLKTEEAAEWLRSERVMTRFTKELGGLVTAGAALCMVIAEYVPISFDPGATYAFARIEEDSGLETGSMREARFIKKIERRAPGQRTAHVIIGLMTPEQANRAIRNGMVIEGKKVPVRRHKMDPKRCMKCQGIGINHNAADCKSIHDVCARCAEMHRTSQCTVEKHTDFKCANCKVKGHGAADRECPVFKERMKTLHAKIPNYAYRFFPTKDPGTWERDGHETTGSGQYGAAGTATGGYVTDAPRRNGTVGNGVKDQGWQRRAGDAQGTSSQGRGAPTASRLVQYRQTTIEDGWNGMTNAAGGGTQGRNITTGTQERNGGTGTRVGDSWADGTEEEFYLPHTGRAQASQSYPHV